jgi:AcrR family transcriptional regulator
VAAAYRAIATHGYPDTSVDVIAREAGLARGLVHYYFETKEELVVASIEQACLEMEILSGSSPGEALEGYLRYDTYLGDPHRTFFRVLLHLGAIALYNPRLGERLRSFLADTRAAAGGLATLAVLDGNSPAPSRTGDAAEGAVLGGILGILLQRELDPEFDARRAFDALVTLARAGDPTLAALADASVTPPVKAARR